MRQVIVFYTFPADAAESNQGQTPTVPAIVVAQNGDGAYLNLRVFTDGAANPIWKTSVPRRDEKNVEAGGYWEPIEELERGDKARAKVAARKAAEAKAAEEAAAQAAAAAAPPTSDAPAASEEAPPAA